MIAEIATIAALSGTAIGYMIGKAGKEAIRARADHWRLRADEFNRKRLTAELELISLRRAKSAAVAKGNITRRLRREAAESAKG